ncbi:MAG: TIGR02449 family protein [SAR86 cluster bacterium]|uniref:TIGR02449 family protein n=1 Tax=SAR86 cluster bacterium TaxID=2030880 RepID=A0A972VYC4_9GAMM|nr:TIGR02449 family protein [SAR86 cluster bacterium]
MEIKDLEAKIDELILLLDEVEHKQAMMTAERSSWQMERSRLLEKNELAKNKVEAMIMRLKALDQDSQADG